LVLEANRVETTDIFRGAFFLCQGGRLSNVRVKEDTRQVVSFLFEMDGIDRLDMDYRSGQALVNPLEFKESINHLRDILFNKLRTGNGGERKNDRKKEKR
jgi:hypothetical protein